ncbi:SHOCT domain-containing protein [Mucilaginibacter sp. UR6-11]|uniref:SHOCT domain-containing protein n=1 Tax=Mucilaginibacter sp. UR6-11 TaxID=1435644 RepID=UPI001E3C4D78|nr:SHOCT domain-containing protein [Mucilaginibacter sp. UR6-11]MCC8427010.1 SHOCT domain-containing protein [Mucilaginibacter sp. UR6-11]
MKKLLFIAALLIPILTKAQGLFGGTSVTEYKASNGVTYHVGDTVRLGRGTKSDGTFMYFEDHGLIPNPRSTRNLPKDFANVGATVKSIRKMKINGVDKYMFSVNPGGPMRYTVFIDDAIEACEVKPCKAANDAKPAATGSVADEIRKLKSLLDSGAITKEEYDAQKKKVLNQ